MLRLHGFDVSNYYNMAKAVLLAKQAEFEAVTVYPGQDADFLRFSPMGKVPVLETDAGHLAETSVIMEYLDETLAGMRFYPQDAFERARVRELCKMVELYIELPARQCYPQAFFGGTVSDNVRKHSEESLRKGLRALSRRAVFAPWLAGADMSAADVVYAFTLDLAVGAARKVLEFDVFEELPAGADLLQRLQQDAVIAQVFADRDHAMADFKRYVASRQQS